MIAAKALRDFAKAHDALDREGRPARRPRCSTAGDIDALADIAPREVLLARLAGGFQAPLVKAAGLFQAFTRNIAYGVKALVDQRVEGGEALEIPAEPEPRGRAPEAEAAEAAAAEARRPRQPAAEAEAPPPRPERRGSRDRTETAEAPTETETTEGE